MHAQTSFSLRDTSLRDALKDEVMIDRPPRMVDSKRITIPPMRLTVSTWNINSVRLRIDLVAKFIKAVRPDVLCLQETKCPDDKFPLKRFRRLGYEHAALNGQKGYHGVAVLFRLPLDCFNAQD